jgi:hypothetical protein
MQMPLVHELLSPLPTNANKQEYKNSESFPHWLVPCKCLDVRNRLRQRTGYTG